MTEQPVWSGPAGLVPLLVAIAELEPWPGNPRRGDVPAIAESLLRFGQKKPIVVDGSRIVAGRHLTLAAQELGWTHVAAVQGEFPDEHEARGFGLADNRTADLAGYDDALLAAQLRAAADADGLDGTGWSQADLAALERSLAAVAEAVRVPPPAPPPSPPAPGKLEYECPSCGHRFHPAGN